MKNILLLSCIIILLTTIAACKKDKENTGKNTNLPLTHDTVSAVEPLDTNTPGFGPSRKMLTGTPFMFPSGITIIGGVKSNISTCTSSAFYECIVDGDLPFFISLQNSNYSTSRIIFPAGIVIPSMDTTIQSGVIVQPDTVIIPPRSTLCVNINAHCLNKNRSFNTSTNFGNLLISDNTNLHPLIRLLATKQPITYDNHIIQNAVWNVANTGMLTDSDIAAINLFP